MPLPRYNVFAGGKPLGERLPKNKAMFEVVKFLANKGENLNEIKECLASDSYMYRRNGNKEDATKAFIKEWEEKNKRNGKGEKTDKVYFIESSEVFEHEGKTYFLAKTWKQEGFDYARRELKNRFHDFDIRVEPSNP